MKIGLASVYSQEDIKKNIQTIINYLNEYRHLDLLLFSESFLQNFNSLTFEYEKDIKIAIEQNSPIFNIIKDTCIKNNISVGFGYYENVSNQIYCSYMIINNNGDIINNYRRISKGWRIPNCDINFYKEGKDIIPFTLGNYKFVTLLCGDFWSDAIKDKVIKIIKKENINVFLWPNHLDYEIKKFDTEIKDYKERTSNIEIPTLLINDHSKSSYGGAIVFENNKILKLLEMGSIGLLEFII